MTDYAVSGFLFDCDGVLVDSIASAGVAWGIWSAEHAPHFDFHRDVEHGRRAEDIVTELLGAENPAAVQQLLQLEIDHVEGTLAIPGAVALTSSLPRDRWTVVTSGALTLASRRVAAAGIPEPSSWTTADDVAHGKPHPEPYVRGASLVGVHPAGCVVFEDAPAGIRSARDAGVAVIIGVGSGALGQGATCVVPDLTAVTYVDGVLRVDDSRVLAEATPRHDGVSRIEVTSTDWTEQFDELWTSIVPPLGAAATVQGEVIRVVGRVVDEIARNGAAEWDDDYRGMLAALPGYVEQGVPLPEIDVLRALTDGMRDGSAVAEQQGELLRLGTAWVVANPEPMALGPTPYDR